MAITRQEVYNYTPEQVETHIADAINLVDALEVPADLRSAAFVQACALLSGKQVLLQETGAAMDLSRLRGGQGSNHDLRG